LRKRGMSFDLESDIPVAVGVLDRGEMALLVTTGIWGFCV
jgi:hypothetical protein